MQHINIYQGNCDTWYGDAQPDQQIQMMYLI